MSSEVDLLALAGLLLGERPAAIAPVAGGANNRIFRVATPSGVFALKLYARDADPRRDRLARECNALGFLRAAGFDSVPEPVARDPIRRAAAYRWIEGTPIEVPTAAEIGALAGFMRRLHRAAQTRPEAAAFPPAVEAVFSGGDLVGQIEARIRRLAAVAEGQPRLGAVLALAWAELSARREGALAVSPPETRTLSPSDFGFHNALRRADGSLAFLDFEYFGWDDPVKLISDVVWHPGHHLEPQAALQFQILATDIYSADRGLSARLAAHFPLYGVRWATIVLNEFLPEERKRREFAGIAGDRSEIEECQLAKAQSLLERIRAREAPLT